MKLKMKIVIIKDIKRLKLICGLVVSILRKIREDAKKKLLGILDGYIILKMYYLLLYSSIAFLIYKYIQIYLIIKLVQYLLFQIK